MEISVENLSPVDKEVTLKANRDDLSPKFDAAFKKYRKEIHMPGFRPGNVPVGLIKKRFGREIELEEINKYVQEIYEKEIVPEHEPIGETQMTDLTWEDDALAVTFKIGAKPDFELADLKSITVDKMVHDVTDEEVQEEIDRTLERNGNWVETDEKITEKSQVTVDAETLDAEGNPVDGEIDKDQKIDLRQEGAAEFRKLLTGKKAGDQETMEVGEGEDVDRFRISVKKVETMEKAELTDAFSKENSNGEAKNADEFKAYIKSKMQDYYDQSSGDLFQQDAVTALTEAHDMDVPEVMLGQIKQGYVEYLKQQTGGQLPPDFNEEEYKANIADQAVREGKWMFISEKLQETFDDIEIKPEDIDEFIGVEAARHGVSADQMKSYYAQNPGQLENLRTSIRENKVFDKLQDVVTINELSKDEFRSKREKEKESSKKS